MNSEDITDRPQHTFMGLKFICLYPCLYTTAVKKGWSWIKELSWRKANTYSICFWNMLLKNQYPQKASAVIQCKKHLLSDKWKVSDKDYNQHGKGRQGYRCGGYTLCTKFQQDSHQPYEANIATVFYKYKNSFVTSINWKHKSKTLPWRRAGQIPNGDVPMTFSLQLHHWGITSELRNTMHLSGDLVAGNYILIKFHHHISISCTFLCVFS